MKLDNPTLLGVYVASITAMASVIISLSTTLISQNFQKSKQKRDELQDIYAGCIKNLAAVTTLSHATEENMNNIESSLVEAKKDLALLLIYGKNKKPIKIIEEQGLLFITGQYKKLTLNFPKDILVFPRSSFEKYDYILDERNKTLLIAADMMLQLIILIAPEDKRL